MVDGGRGGVDRGAIERARFYGPVVTDAAAPPFLGAERATNNTAELTALAEALHYLREEGTTGPAVIRPDSEYAAHVALGLTRCKANVALAAAVRALWQSEYARRGGQLWILKVKGHSGHVWNDAADRAAARGAAGASRGGGARWSEWPPLMERVARAHEIDEVTRVLRASDPFGVLALVVPVDGGVHTAEEVTRHLARIERQLHSDQSTRARCARERARAARRLLLEPLRQQAEAQRLVSAGLQPVTNTVRCTVDVAALRQYELAAGPEADAVQAARPGKRRAAGRYAAGHGALVL